MASSPRDVEREEERRLNMRTLTIASAASAAAAAVTSQLWIAGTWIAAALTPVLVALISEALHRPTERVARARTTRRTAAGGGAATTSPKVMEPDLGPIRVYRQPDPPPPSEPPEDEPSDTAPLPEPTEPAPGEPEQPVVP